MILAQVRVRPGDSLLIAGLVRENDQLDRSGPGFSNVLFPTSRTAKVDNRELVFLLKPRVIVYTDDKAVLRQQNTGQSKAPIAPMDSVAINPANIAAPKIEIQPEEIEPVDNNIPLDLLNPAP